MPRSRVLSFMSQWGNAPRSPTEDSHKFQMPSSENVSPSARQLQNDSNGHTPMSSTIKLDAYGPGSPGSNQQTTSRARGDSKARPTSMLQTYTAPQIGLAAADTPPELQPIFGYLNSHGSKLYQEGYFLKLHDLDSRGRPSQDRTWVECFAQLIGTVLSLWDAAALDAAGEDGEVVPTFINLSDASIKMIESLPMNGVHGGTLQNVLSISTAANNRYLLHFNSLNSLTQWTAGIRLAMFEHATLQEAYTGSLIAGKGRHLNNIRQIMERSKFAHEDWARVRFGAGTPWRRCWCVVSPPDEKEFAKAQKTLKKTSAYERVKMPKGDIKFYDTRKVTKKTKPIATITDAYAAYAIYPQSKPLIDQSTLVKLEGLITIHSSMINTAEGFIFVMPEVHPAVTGFEMMLRWLFPVYDAFGLYGRPTRLIADSLDQRGLMFAMPKERRYGYLDILDVSSLIHTKGSQAWSERQWRREMKKMTSERVLNQMDPIPGDGRQPSQRRATSGVRFGNGSSIHSTPGSRSASPGKYADLSDGPGVPRVDSAPPGQMFTPPHKRSASDAVGYRRHRTETPSRLSYEAMRPGEGVDEEDIPPEPPRHGGTMGSSYARRPVPGSLQRIHSEPEVPTVSSNAVPPFSPPAPVVAPPTMMHQPNSRPPNEPYQAPELRREHSTVDAATLHQMREAGHPPYHDDGLAQQPNGAAAWTAEVQHRQQYTVASPPVQREAGTSADPPSQGLVTRSFFREPRHRLSTIPGSPFVGADAGTPTPTSETMPQMDGVAEEAESAPQDGRPSQEVRPAATRALHSSTSIMRKPVPKPTPVDVAPAPQAIEDPGSPDSPINTEGIEGGLIDDEALERVLNQDRASTMHSADRASTMHSATTESTVPDYASTVSEVAKPLRQRQDNPRAGKLKTVGDPELASTDPRVGRLDTWHADQAGLATEIPVVDFGPTYAYKPTGRPATGATATNLTAEKPRANAGSRSNSQDRLSGYYGGSARSSPHESNRQSYFGGRNTPSPSGYRTPTAIEEAGNRHSVAWQPSGPAGVASGPAPNVTPEQWVQQRAQLAQQTPQYALPAKKTPLPAFAHERTTSATARVARKLTKTPPPQRALSTDRINNPALGRSTPPTSRPQSRGGAATLEPHALSAKEQMHVSRVTGTPLLHVGPPTNSPGHPTAAADPPGLVGYVSAREQEKAANRQSLLVQQAILDRQQQQQQQQHYEQAQYYSQQWQQPPPQQQQQGGMYTTTASQPVSGSRPLPQHQHSWSYEQQTPRTYTAPAGPPFDGLAAQPQPQQGAVPRQAYGASFYNQSAARR